MQRKTIITIVAVICCSCVSMLSFMFGGVGGLYFWRQKKVNRPTAPDTPTYTEPKTSVSESPRKRTNYGGSGGNYFEKICPGTSYITELSGGSGAILDSVSVKCSDGTNLGGVGGNGGNYYKLSVSPGDNISTYHNGTLVEGIKVGSQSTGTTTGKIGVSDCSSNITGIWGASGVVIDSLGVIC
jgi:hypothetical protein